MPRVRSAKSDVSDGDMDEMAEQEVEMQRLQKLLRQYRIMENDRKMYCQESQDMIKQQRWVVAGESLIYDNFAKNGTFRSLGFHPV